MTRAGASERALEGARIRNRRYRERHKEEEHARNVARHAANRDANNAASRAWHAAHREEANARMRERSKTSWRKWVHGLSQEEHEALYAAQGGLCAICARPGPISGPGCLHIDHDHTTGERRGLLCHLCNSALRAVERDGATWTLRALTYLGDTPLARLRKGTAA